MSPHRTPPWRQLVAALVTALALQKALAASPEPSQPTPRNIVFILLDDLRFDAMGFLKPGLQTPHIDQLAKEGGYFPNAVVTSALCSPSRATILTGQTARNHRIFDNNDSSEAGLTFFPQYLQKAGYQTGFFGKWHMGQATDAPRPGFDRWVSFAGQGSYFPEDGIPADKLASGVRQTLNVDGQRVAQKGYITDELTDYALDWLAHGRDPSKPFFLYLSHKAVHSDFKPAPRHATQYADLDIPLPDSMADTEANNAGKPMWVRNQRNSWHGVDFPYHTTLSIQAYLREYYRTLSAVDDSVGRILTWLREQHLDEHTLVVFYSDNGFLFGEHGLIDKRNAYEPSVRVPLIVRAPGLVPAGSTHTARVRNLDMAPTLMDVAGVPPPPQFEGRSFLPLATGQVKDEQWAQPDFVYEYYWEWSFPHTPTTFAIVHEDIKYIQYHGVWDTEELYDLRRDPSEQHNLINDPAYLAAKIDLRQRLFTQLRDNKGEHTVPYGARFSSGQVWRSPQGAQAASFPPEWLKAPNRSDRFQGLRPDTTGSNR